MGRNLQIAIRRWPAHSSTIWRDVDGQRASAQPPPN